MKILYPLAKRFIAGYDFDSAKPTIDELIKVGYEVSIDYVGELSKTILDCDKAKAEYVKIINYYRRDKIDISIKPSQLGLNIDYNLCYMYLSYLAKMAKLRGHTIRLDMEDSSVTSQTIRLAIRLNGRFGNVGVAVQSNLIRTEQDLKDLIENSVSVRLVKGAYKEKKEIAYQIKGQIYSLFYANAASLYSNKANKPAIATHDEELLEDIEELIPNPKFFDYEFLYGIRRDLQENYKNKGHKVRIYVPFGEDWVPYTLRRLKEWKNLMFVIKNIVKEWCK
tara:strand:- start:30 stop:869 length:840 start_codon:yes stop_codon:yes gene_type:complete